METLKKHIIFKIITVFISVTILAPVAVKLIHSFEHQEHHTACDNGDAANIHECEIDCPLLKYNLSQYNLEAKNYTTYFYVLYNFEVPSLVYDFFTNHRIQHFSLRGPPALV